MIRPDQIRAAAAAATPRAVELRRLLHRHPEPAHQEHRTTDLIADSLDECGIGFVDRRPKTGLWADLGEDPSLGFRADLDGLPIVEPEDNVPRSQNPGWMHACGHDAHAAIAFGVALALRHLEPGFGARVLFQPAEEAFPGGAAELIEEGVCHGLKAIIAFHVDPSLETGVIGHRVGPITASADEVVIVVHGPGGHTARPHQTVDLVAEAARLVHELPRVLRRRLDPRSPLSLAFGSIHGGTRGNVIPTRVELQGTARTLDPDLWGVLPGLVDEAVSVLLTGSGAGYDLEYVQGIPPVVNDPSVVETVVTGIAEVAGQNALVTIAPSMGGEDFANYLGSVPGALLRLGSSAGGGDLHSPSFRLDEASIGVGIEAGVAALVALGNRL